MKTKSIAYLNLGFLFLFFTACQSTPSDPQTWGSDMQGLAQVLAEAIPILHKSTPLVSEDRGRITQIADKLQRLSQSVNHNQYFPSQDPTFIRAAEALESELAEIRQELKQGKERQVVRRLGSVTQYCISCHTMREGYEGHMNRDWNRYADGLSPLHRAEYFAATRQFDLSLLEYEKALSDQKFANQNPKSWNDSVLRMLAIIVRVKNDPNLSLEMISRFFDVSSYPAERKEVARTWRREIQKWEREEKKKATPIAMKSVEKLIRQAQALPAEGASLIQDLRASRIMHLLKSGAFKDRDEQQKLYYFSAQVAERLHNLNMWDEPQDYFVLCVERAPQTATAQLCRDGYKKYWSQLSGEKDPKLWPASAQKQWKSIQ